MQQDPQHPLPGVVGGGVHGESAVPARVPRARPATADAPGDGRGDPFVPAELYQIITQRLSDAEAEVVRLSAMRARLEQQYGPFDLQTDTCVSTEAPQYKEGDGRKVGDNQ